MKRLIVPVSSFSFLILFLLQSNAQTTNLNSHFIPKQNYALKNRIDILGNKINILSIKVDSLKRMITLLSKGSDTTSKKIASKDTAHLKFRGMIFSDIVGIKDDQPNGLIQTNFYFSYERPDISDKSTLIPLKNIVLVDITLSKIENDEYKLPVRYVSQDSTKGYLNQLDLLQYAHIKAASKFNLICYHLKDDFDIYFDLLAGFFRTAIYDSLKISNTKNLNTLTYGINVKLRTKEDKTTNLAADFSYCYLKSILFSDVYQAIGGPQNMEYPYQLTQDIVNKEISGINIIDLTIRHVQEKTDKFLKIAICGNYFGRKGNTPNIFYQFQIGIGFNILNWFESAESKGSTKDKTGA